MKMVSILDRHDKTHFVNPEYVTAISPAEVKDGYSSDAEVILISEVTVVGNGGYGTFRIDTLEAANDLAARLQKD